MNRFDEMRDEIMRTLTLIINYYLHNKKNIQNETRMNIKKSDTMSASTRSHETWSIDKSKQLKLSIAVYCPFMNSLFN